MNFIASALKVPSSERTFFICGKRHCNCFEQLKEEKHISYNKQDIVQGFMVQDEKDVYFVDRYEGAVIAKKLGYELEYPNCLYSEDIWPPEEGDDI